MTRKFYEKIGKKYVEIGEYTEGLWDSIPIGSHLIVRNKDSMTRRYEIDPAYAPYLAAMVNCREDVCKAIHKASEARPQRKLVTPQEQALWNQLREVADINYITYPSSADIAEAAFEIMYEKIKKKLENPAVKEAYDHFLLMVKLCEDSSE